MSSAEGVLTLRKMTASDVPDVVSLHLRAFQGFFLSFLGARFLAVLYRSLLAEPTAVSIVADGNTGVVGFAVGTTALPGLYRALLRRRKWDFAVAAARPLLRKPSVASRLFRATRAPEVAEKAKYPASLMSIAVDPSLHGTGLGGRLLNEFCSELRSRGIDGCCLTTDELGNSSVRSFYERHGWAVVRSYVTPEGRSLCEYARSLQP
jgi:GNAT superfamily N-acetyltransferase